MAFSHRLTAQRPDLKAAVDAVTELYLRMRYAGLAGAEPLRTLRRRIAQFQPDRR